MNKKSIFFRAKKKVSTYKIRLACKYDELKILQNLNKERKHNRIYLFGSPNQVNLGDQAQTYCIVKWLNRNFPNHEVFVFTYYTITNKVLSTIRKTITENDKIFIHSGYHITDLYNMVDKYCDIIKMFPDYKIVIMPQTINFIKDRAKESYVSDVFNAHGNITLLCRDAISHEKAKSIFAGCKLLLYPDIVTSLIGTMHFSNHREGILFCMRNDKEALYDKKSIKMLTERLRPIETSMTDTDSPLFYRTIQLHREEILNDKWNQFARYKVVITDRYHGTIFALIAGTPVIVLSSTDHKLSSGVTWFPKEFGKMVSFANDLDEAYKKAVNLYNTDVLPVLPAYFENNYYSKLKNQI